MDPLPTSIRKVPEHTAVLIGVIHIVNSVTSAVIGILDLCMSDTFDDGYIYIATPIWAGVLYLITGIFAIVSRKTTNIHLVNSFFAFSILSTAAALTAVVLLAYGRTVGDYPIAMVGIPISVVAFIFGICGTVIAAYGMNCECNCGANPQFTGQFIYTNVPNQAGERDIRVIHGAYPAQTMAVGKDGRIIGQGPNLVPPGYGACSQATRPLQGASSPITEQNYAVMVASNMQEPLLPNNQNSSEQ